MKNKAYLAFMVYNIGLFILIGWGIWYLKSAMPLIALMFVMKVKIGE